MFTLVHFHYLVSRAFSHVSSSRNGTQDVDKNSCYLIPLSSTIYTSDICWKEMMPINTINSLNSPVETLDDYVSLVQAHRLHDKKADS